MTTFADLKLKPELLQALEAKGYDTPMEIQEKTIPAILAGEHILGQAPTGTGKTLAYLLPAFQQIDPALRQAQAIVLAPTYELAMQITGVAREISENSGLGIRVQGIIGGANIARQIDKLKEKPQLIVGSAGRIIELARKGKLKLSKVRLLVLDEFDRLLDDQNLQYTAEIVRLIEGEKQIVMFSATAPKKALERANFLEKPQHIIVRESPAVAAARENLYVMTPFRDKIEAIRKLTRRLEVKRGLVFINRVFDTEKTLDHLRYEGIKADSLLGHSNKQARQKAIADFKAGRIQLLLSTDLAARGLDIPEVDYVFNLDLPESAAVYQHRAGRTARAGAKGTVITLVDNKEAYKLEQLEKSLGIAFKSMQKTAKAEGGSTKATKPKKAKAKKDAFYANAPKSAAKPKKRRSAMADKGKPSNHKKRTIEN